MGNTESSLGSMIGSMLGGVLLAPVTGGASMVFGAVGAGASMGATAYHASNKTPSSDHPVADFVIGAMTGTISGGAGYAYKAGELALTAGLSVGGAIVGPTLIAKDGKPAVLPIATPEGAMNDMQKPKSRLSPSQFDCYWEAPQSFNIFSFKSFSTTRMQSRLPPSVSSDMVILIAHHDLTVNNIVKQYSDEITYLRTLQDKGRDAFIKMVVTAVNVADGLKFIAQTDERVAYISYATLHATQDSIRTSLSDTFAAFKVLVNVRKEQFRLKSAKRIREIEKLEAKARQDATLQTLRMFASELYDLSKN